MKNKINGSFTIEAALVIPIVLFTIFSLIFLSFYLYDICRIQAVADNALHKASITMKHESDLASGRTEYEKINDRGVFYLLSGATEEESNEINRYIGQELEDSLFFTDISDIDVEAGKYKVVIKIKGRFHIPIRGISDLLPINQDIHVVVDSPVHDPADTIRIAEVVLETGSKIKGVDKLMDQLREILP